MRWLFAEPHDCDARERSLLVERAHTFWSALAPELDSLAILPANDARQRVLTHLRQVDRRLDAEILQDSARRQLILTPRGERHLRPLVDVLLARAPDLDGWATKGYLPARPLPEALASVQARCGLDLSAARVRAGFSRGHLIELVVSSPDVASAEDELAQEAALGLVEWVLGERIVDHWIGQVHVAPGARRGPLRMVPDERDSAPTLALEELSETVGAAIEGLVAGLPDRPWCENIAATDWTLFEVEPELASDYAAQDDVALASTRAPEMLKCFLEGAPFSSLRFSKHQEHFAYLKLDWGGDSESRLRERTRLEEALSDQLSRRVGSVVGNGLGIRYSYLDLALGDLQEGVEQVRSILRSAGAPKRSWLLFCDSDWRDEWVGIWDDSPRPPRSIEHAS